MDYEHAGLIEYDICTNRQLDLLSLPPVEENIEESRMEVVESLSNLPKLCGNGGDICFHIAKNETEVISLFESFLQMKLRVIKLDDQGNEKYTDAEDIVSYSPLIAQSLFRSLQITANNQALYENADVHFPYKAFTLMMLYTGKEAQATHLAGTGFLPSTIGTHAIVDPNSRQTNSGLVDRRSLALNSNLCEFATPVIDGLFQCPRVLPGEVDLKFNFYLNTPEFCLVMPKLEDNAPNPRYDIRIEEAKLYLQKYKLTSDAADSVKDMLETKGLLYPVINHNLCNFIVQNGENSFRRALPITNMPRMIYLFFVNRSALHSKHVDPFNFESYGLQEAFIEADGRKFPQNQGYTPDIAHGFTRKDYRMMLGEMGHKLPKDTLINQTDWANGIFILPFNMTPDRSVGCDYVSPNKELTTPIIVNLRWNQDLKEPISVMVMTEHYKLLHLNADGKFSWND